ncbi:MAG: HRDC domain-containing protein, partial [Paramuribaculum sp.]|nr:HRDC domain-containing protein [Paramuribaculum sp.]
LIETVMALKEKFKADYVIDVLRGRLTSDVKSYHHEKLETFGSCNDCLPRHLNAVVRQSIIGGYIERDIENFGLLKLTAKAHEFLRKPTSFTIVEDAEFNDYESECDNLRSGAGSAADAELFAILRNLRKEVADKLNLPPYIIFQDPSLEAMATTYPVSIDELANIPGVGAGKARRYGAKFVDVIRRHVETNEIQRPEDLVVRTVANKSKVKISIIHAIDRKIPLDEIARSKGMSLSELMDEIEAILNSGTKININYHINELLDDEQQDDLFDYFRESDTGNLDEAYAELSDEFNEEEIRLMKIKFIAEMGY